MLLFVGSLTIDKAIDFCLLSGSHCCSCLLSSLFVGSLLMVFVVENIWCNDSYCCIVVSMNFFGGNLNFGGLLLRKIVDGSFVDFCSNLGIGYCSLDYCFDFGVDRRGIDFCRLIDLFGGNLILIVGSVDNSHWVNFVDFFQSFLVLSVHLICGDNLWGLLTGSCE